MKLSRAAVTTSTRLARAISAEARREPTLAPDNSLERMGKELAETIAPFRDRQDLPEPIADVVFWSQAAASAITTLDVAPTVSAGDFAVLARRASMLVAAMRFDFLYDRRRRIFTIGYRLADAKGPGRVDASFYDLLASEARLASFVAIAKGDVPQHHWFHLGRMVTNVDGQRRAHLVGRNMFEYLMPQLLLRSYPGTLLDQSCRASVRRQVEYGKEHRVPWGISESAYSSTDRAGNYQYKAFGVPGLGFKRGLADELVVAPYATALAGLIDPAARRLEPGRTHEPAGLDGRFGFCESIDFQPRTPLR